MNRLGLAGSHTKVRHAVVRRADRARLGSMFLVVSIQWRDVWNNSSAPPGARGVERLGFVVRDEWLVLTPGFRDLPKLRLPRRGPSIDQVL